MFTDGKSGELIRESKDSRKIIKENTSNSLIIKILYFVDYYFLKVYVITKF